MTIIRTCFMFLTPIAAMLCCSLSCTATKTEKKAFAVVFDGLSSCGKTSTSKELQQMYADNNIPSLYLSGDEFIRSFPEQWRDIDANRSSLKAKVPVKKDEGFYFDQNASGEVTSIHVGSVVEKYMNAVADIIKSLLDSGTNVIFDGVLTNAGLNNIRALQKNYTIYTIFVTCSEEQASAREKERNGWIGLSMAMRNDKNQFFAGAYDFTLRRGELSKAERAQLVFDYIQAKIAK